MTRPTPVNIKSEDLCAKCDYVYDKTCLIHKSCRSCEQYLKLSNKTIDGGLTNCKCNTVIDKSKCPYFSQNKF